MTVNSIGGVHMMLAGIRKKLMGTYFLIILITILFFEFAFVIGIHNYYLNSVSNNLKNKAELVSSFYNNFLDTGDIYSNSKQIIDLFAERSFQLQITDKSGNVIADSLGLTEKDTLAAYKEVKASLSGKKSEFNGRQLYTGERIYVCTVPLTSNGMIVGAMRFSTSLEQTYQVIYTLVQRLLVFGLILLGSVFLMGVFLATKIFNPIEEEINKSN